MKYNVLGEVSFLELIKNARNILLNPLPFHRRNFAKHGDVFRVHLGGGKKVLFTRDPNMARHMLQKQHRKYHKSSLQTKDLAKYIGEGLLTSNGEKWLQQRRLIQPAFHRKKLKILVDTMRDVIESSVMSFPKNKEIDVLPLMSDLAFEVVAKSLFGYEDPDTISRLQYITEKAQHTLIKEVRQPYKKWWFYLTGVTQRTLRLTKDARKLLEKIIQDRRASGEKKDDLLGMLLESRYDNGNAMSMDQLIDEILILFVAGHETTANALAFSLFLLAKDQKIQQKVFEEVSKVDPKGAIFESLNELSYTRQCIEETMRLYPPAYFSDRVSIADDTFEGMELPAGTQVLISFYEIHRNSQFWEQAEIFNPDRFDPVAKKDFSNCYFPFGSGPRMCIGNNFAMYEMVIALYSIVRSYKITTNETSIEVTPLITLKPKNARLTFDKRTN
ncbi:cytochrome P450 [Aquimarina hainanensis]|uniref:Cytochrome P450 n=1 Tax=Aquimarina hainanensis TaxID=1578017 RepID=A0ABW5N981_9FLAO